MARVANAESGEDDNARMAARPPMSGPAAVYPVRRVNRSLDAWRTRTPFPRSAPTPRASIQQTDPFRRWRRGHDTIRRVRERSERAMGTAPLGTTEPGVSEVES